MKKKIFFIVSSLRAGGSERVFWLLAQHFDTAVYDVSLVLVDGRNPFFSTHLQNVKVVDLHTIKASRSFFPLLQLVKKERPHAIFVTGTHVNILVATISFFISVPTFIARESNIPAQMVKYAGQRGKLVNLLIRRLYKRFDAIVCQSLEMKASLAGAYSIQPDKLVIISNPVIPGPVINSACHVDNKRLIIVARMSKEKGYDRLLHMMKDLPPNYRLTIAGSGPLKDEIERTIAALEITDKVQLVGQVSEVTALIATHDLFILSSYTEGFPNVVIESLSVGTPVVAFSVGGLSNIIVNDFNGYIIGQNDIDGCKAAILKACNKHWDRLEIKKDIEERFGIKKIVDSYSNLIK